MPLSGTLHIDTTAITSGVPALMGAAWMLPVLLLVFGILAFNAIMDSITNFAVRVILALSGRSPAPVEEVDDEDEDDE